MTFVRLTSPRQCPYPAQVDKEEILTGIAIIVGLAVTCQLLAPKLRIPALVLLLPAGFLAGVIFPSVDPIGIFGSAFTPLVNIAVGLILFHGGLELVEEQLVRKDRRIIQRLIFIGSLITWACASAAFYFLLGVSSPIALLLGAIVIVSGPTVVGPLLDFVKPEIRIRRILAWEGTLIDPVGALIAVIVFQAIQASSEPSLGRATAHFFTRIGIGLVGGLCGIGLIWLGMHLYNDNRVLGTEVLLGAVIVTTAITDAVADDAGLVAAVVMGMLAPLLVKERIHAVKPFFDTIVTFSIGVLFVAISSLVTPASIEGLVLPCLGVVAILVLVVRPGSAILLTARSTLTLRERLFVGWMAPRGIVAAATAASFSATLIAANVEDSDKLLPATFLIIVGTVVFYSATAVPMASLLKVRGSDSELDEADREVSAM